MAQTIEGFVGKALDDAKISQMHVKVVALIAAGYFFDVIDLIVLGSLIPDMIQSKFATGAEAALVGQGLYRGFHWGVVQGHAQPLDCVVNAVVKVNECVEGQIFLRNSSRV